MKVWEAWKKKNKSVDVIWRGFDAICVCVKMATEVMLLYKIT